MDKQDKEDIKNILREQAEYISILIDYIRKNLQDGSDVKINSLTFLTDIDECNMTMMEIVEGPKGTVERMI